MDDSLFVRGLEGVGDSTQQRLPLAALAHAK